MNQSASLVLPVRNQSSALTLRVTAAAEVLAELTADFEILVVDYGSDDDTLEVTRELSRKFPQVQLLRCSGVRYEAVEVGLYGSSGDIIFVHDMALPLSVSALRTLWAMRRDSDLVMAHSRSSDVKPSTLDDYSTAAAKRRQQYSARQRLSDSITDEPVATATQPRAVSSIQMIRRCAIDQYLREANPGQVEPANIRLDRSQEVHPVKRLPSLLLRLNRLANTEPVRRRPSI